MIVVAAVVLFSTLGEYSKTETLYADTASEYVSIADDIEKSQNLPLENSSEIDIVDTEELGDAWWTKAKVDLVGLESENSDIVGWLFFENEKISYPILYSGDNSKYLHTTYTGESAKAGSIFLDGESTPDFTDPVSLIYGHNMRDLSMFGRLKYYKTDKDYYDNHRYFQIFTGDKVYRYKVFAYEDVKDSHDVYYAYGSNPAGVSELLDKITRNSYCKSDVELSESDKIVTLSTCTADDTERLIVCGVCEDEHEYIN